MAKFKFFDVRRTMSEYPDAKYYVFFGERSNGKTFSALDLALENYGKRGEQFAYIRRFGEDIKKGEMQQLFAGLNREGRISHWTKNEWENIDFGIGKFFPCRRNDKGLLEKAQEPIGHAFNLSSMEHYKSLEYPKISLIIFDEFITRTAYLPNEWVLFQNMLSTIIRLRNDVKIVMLGNTVNRYSIYFNEMGLKHVKDQSPGTTDLYRYGSSGLQVVCCYTDPSAKRGGKPSDIYFAFDNPELRMITAGEWEIAAYPHLTERYKPKDKAYDFFIEFDRDLLHGEIIVNDNGQFIFIHEKTTPIKDEAEDIVYTTYAKERWNYKMCLTKQTDKLSRFICDSIKENRVFYSTNEVGEIFRNYLIWSEKFNIKN